MTSGKSGITVCIVSTTNTGGTMQATEDKTYNGWSNYATWGVALVLDNDEGIYNYVRQQAFEIRANARANENVETGIWTADECAKYLLSDFLKDFTEELCEVPDSHTRWAPGIREPLMARQVIQAGLAEVNWDEIAENVLSES